VTSYNRSMITCRMTAKVPKFEDGVYQFIGKRVSVETAEGRIYEGWLVSIDENLNVILEDIIGEFNRMIINGNFVKEVKLSKSLNMSAFIERLNELFPGLVKVVENTIIVMDNIKITERGVQGSGLAADRVKAIYAQFTRESK